LQKKRIERKKRIDGTSIKKKFEKVKLKKKTWRHIYQIKLLSEWPTFFFFLLSEKQDQPNF
jgi:hypothetical protein